MKKVLAFVSLEVSVSYWLIDTVVAIDWVEGSVASLLMHYLVLIGKSVLMAKEVNYKLQLIFTCLILQSIGLGVLMLHSDVRTQFIQTVILTQYLLAYSTIHCKMAITVFIYYTIPEIFYYSYSPKDLLPIIIISIIAIIMVCWISTEKPSPTIELQHEKPIMVEQISIKSSIKHRIMTQLPYLTDERFIVLNDSLECVYEQASLVKLVEDDISYDINQLLDWLLEAKPDCVSNSMSKLIYADMSEITYKQRRINFKFDIRELCLLILADVSSHLTFFSISELETKLFKLAQYKINIFILQDNENDDNYILLHLEHVPERKLQKTKSVNTLSHNVNLTQKSNDSLSSTLLANIFSSISHEFGTYLNCILTVSTECLKDDQVPDDIKDNYLQPIAINSKLLQYILQNIRDFNSILVHQFSLKLQEFNPIEQLNEVLQLVGEQLEQRNNKLVINCPINISIYNDAERFKQVLYQLLSNSIRFTYGGTITIEVNNQKEYLTVSVSDTGIGMTIQEQSRLGELLKDNRKMLKISSNSVGCGLGLSISNAIVNNMGHGSKKGITFQSNPSRGSVFNFTVSNSYQLYNDSVYMNSQTYVKVLNSTYYIEHQPSEYGSYRLSMSGYRSNFLLESERYEAVNNKRSNSTRKQSQETHQQFFQVQYELKSQTQKNDIEESSYDGSDDSPGLQQCIPSLETNFKTHILGYKLSSTCCSRVLIVDDEYFNILSIQMILKKFNTITDKAFNGQQALKLIDEKSRKPCRLCKNRGYMVYFLDINMPIMDGFETVRELKRRMSDNLIPKGLCIANTGYADLDTKQRSLNAGMDFYLTKPVKINELERYLRDKFRDTI